MEENENKEVNENENKEELKSIVFLTKFEDFFLNLFDKIHLKFLSDIYRKKREVWRYLIFGALATVVNIVVYMIGLKIFGISNAISNAIAWVAAAVFAYFTNKFFVFASKVDTKKALFREVVSFFSCRLFTLVIDEAIMIISVDKLHWNELLMKIIANIVVIVLNYIFSKILIFAKKDKGEKN